MKNLENIKATFIKAFELLNQEHPDVGQAKLLLLDGEVTTKELIDKKARAIELIKELTETNSNL